MTRRRMLYTVIALVMAFGAFASRPPAMRTTPATLTAATVGAAPYHWFGANITICPNTPLKLPCGGAMWSVTDHIGGWANGSTVLFATHSGYPWCQAQGYNITVTGCTWHGGGSEIYARIDWQNCVLLWGIGCVSDGATMGFNGAGQWNYFHEDWPDAYP